MLFEKNPQYLSKIDLEKNKIVFTCHDENFSGFTISKIIKFINTVHNKYKKIKITLLFSFGHVILADKLSYIIFECICYYLMKECHHKVYVYWQPESNILVDGIFCSPLKLLNTSSIDNLEKFLQSFKMDIYQRHFRRLIDGDDKENTNYLGNLLQELDSFLKFFSIVEEYREQISEVITELVGNACEHGHTNCLLDIDITRDGAIKIDNVPQEGKFYGINIAIINFSNILLGDGVKEKLDKNNLGDTRYDDLRRAYNYHKNYFTKDYSYSDFYNISALQDKISGRRNYSLSGGTGLTKLIHSIQERSHFNSCYVLSGNRCVFFYKDLLNYDKNKWLGFNRQIDFFNSLPDKDVIKDCYIYFPGTAYNLNFVMKREDRNYENN